MQEVCELLIPKTILAAINAVTADGWTALTLAASMGMKEVCELLIPYSNTGLEKFTARLALVQSDQWYKLANIRQELERRQDSKLMEIRQELQQIKKELEPKQAAIAVPMKLSLSVKSESKEPVPPLVLRATSSTAPNLAFFEIGPLADSADQTIRQISALIREGNDRLHNHYQQGILLLGNTGAGKSTLAHLLSNQPLQTIFNDELEKYVVDAIYPTDQLVIGRRIAYETTVPNKVIVGETVIWDRPDFNDTNPAQEIANGFYIQRLAAMTTQLKIVLVVPEDYLTHDRGHNFLETLDPSLPSANAGTNKGRG